MAEEKPIPGEAMKRLAQNTTPISQKTIWLWFGITAVIALTGFLLFVQNAASPVPTSWGVQQGPRNELNNWLIAVQNMLLSPLLASVLGVSILSRRPQHRIGRLLVALGLIIALMMLSAEWALYGYYTLKRELMGAAFTAWLSNWLWVTTFIPLLLIAALFPDGNYFSRSWRWIITLLLSIFTISLLLGGMIETPMSSAYQIPNPWVEVHPTPFYNVVFTTGVVALSVTVLAVFLTVIVRFIHSQGQERQQMKWLMYGVGLMAFFILFGLGLQFGLNSTFGALMANSSLLGPTLGVGVALLRYRLYDIDILIRRTLQYTLLTGLLAALFFGGVLLFQTIIGALTGAENSPLVTVLTTLGIAALFNPLRARIQNFIDRRFYRAKYDAAQILSSFATTARDEVDLDRLATALLGVAERTMQPEQITLWLKEIEN
jgi:hypothetical protein